MSSIKISQDSRRNSEDNEASYNDEKALKTKPQKSKPIGGPKETDRGRRRKVISNVIFFLYPSLIIVP